MIEFYVPGRAVPAGSKKHVGHGVVIDTSGAQGKQWRAVVQLAAASAFQGPPLEGPLRVTMWFGRLRPKAHFKANGELRSNAPAYPTGKPDVLKLARAVEDACTGILWRDDAQIVYEALCKVYAEVAGLRVTVEAP